MKVSNGFYIILVTCILSLIGLSTNWISQVNGGTLKIEYEYDSRAICVGARATLDGDLVGKARLEDLEKGRYFLVRETHYSPQSGEEIYEGLSQFSLGSGMKISETRISGRKIMEIFDSWPSGMPYH